MNQYSEPTTVDTAASAACTRAGSFALLLSALLALLIPYWTGRYNEVAVGQYLVDRSELAIKVDGLDDDPWWQLYKGSTVGAESKSIAELREASATKSIPGNLPPTTPQVVHKSAEPAGGVPSAPGIVSITITSTQKLDRVSDIAGFLEKLNDSNMLTRSRQVSHFFDVAIVRWIEKRNNLLYKNAVNHACFSGDMTAPSSGQKSKYFVPAVSTEALMKCLTLDDVQQLARFELPTLSSPMQNGEFPRREIDVALGVIPHDLFWASIMSQVLLVFVIVYFGAFTREAVSSANFPVPGTLFGAFSRSRQTLLMLLVVLLVPVIASLGVAIVSGQWVLGVLTILVTCAVVSVYLVLHAKSYFGVIDPIRSATEATANQIPAPAPANPADVTENED
jgi:hypothetical protein